MTARAVFRPARVLVHIGMVAALLAMLYPLFWMVSASFKPEVEIFQSVSLLPREPTLDNYIHGWTALHVPFTRFFLNSIVLCTLAVIGNTVSCTLAAFAFARLKFPFRRLLFGVTLTTIMLPHTATTVTQFVLFTKLGWVGTMLPLVLPKFLAVDAFFVFLIVQFMRNIPASLDDAAKMDGCGPFRLFLYVHLPLLTPALATTAIFTFIFTWNDFYSQLLYLGNSIDSFTVPVALRAFVDETSTSSWGQTLAMSLLSLLPIVAFFAVFQRKLVEGISTTGFKG
jgi:multiple sugar transport system permease protein